MIVMIMKFSPTPHVKANANFTPKILSAHREVELEAAEDAEHDH